MQYVAWWLQKTAADEAAGHRRGAPGAGGRTGRPREKGRRKKMQTERTNLDHHHQKGCASTGLACSSPEAELIALARAKGQSLTQHTLRLIRDTLELRGVTLEAFVADVRPHFRNNILNPSGFLINRARQFHQLSRAAVDPEPSTSVQSVAIKDCEVCKGQKLVIKESNFQPCPGCSTPEFRREWETKEAERERKLRAVQSLR